MGGVRYGSVDLVDVHRTDHSVVVNVPVVRRSISRGEDAGEHFLVMDRIRGKILEQLWPHIEPWGTI